MQHCFLLYPEMVEYNIYYKKLVKKMLFIFHNSQYGKIWNK